MQKVLMCQDNYGTHLHALIEQAIKDGWKVVPGSIGMVTIEVRPTGDTYYMRSDERIKTVSQWCVVENGDERT